MVNKVNRSGTDGNCDGDDYGDLGGDNYGDLGVDDYGDLGGVSMVLWIVEPLCLADPPSFAPPSPPHKQMSLRCRLARRTATKKTKAQMMRMSNTLAELRVVMGIIVL